MRFTPGSKTTGQGQGPFEGHTRGEAEPPAPRSHSELSPLLEESLSSREARPHFPEEGLSQEEHPAAPALTTGLGGSRLSSQALQAGLADCLGTGPPGQRVCPPHTICPTLLTTPPREPPPHTHTAWPEALSHRAGGRRVTQSGPTSPWQGQHLLSPGLVLGPHSPTRRDSRGQAGQDVDRPCRQRECPGACVFGVAVGSGLSLLDSSLEE